jgi:long-chain acyl-CoA synthetase
MLSVMATQAPSPPATAPAAGRRTIGEIWRRAARSGRTGTAYLHEEDGTWKEVLWAEAGRRVDELAHGLLSLGLRRGDRLAILAQTRLEWALLDFALARIGVAVVPIYATSSERDLAYILEHSEAVGIVAEDEEQRARVERIRAETPRVKHVLTFADLDDLAARGRVHAKDRPHAVDEVEATIGEDDLLMIVYTSGTTGPPKGCMMLHRNYAAVVEALDRIEDFHRADERCLLFLPLAHTYAQLTLYAAAYAGYAIAFCPDMTRIPDAIAAVRPSSMPSVPRVYEKVHGAVLAQFDAATGVKRKLIDWAMRVGRESSRRLRADESLPLGLALQRRLADQLVYSKVKAKLGGNLRFGISGAAPISVEILEFFHALDIHILEGYGLTESASGCSVNQPHRYRFGTVGPTLPGIEVRVDEDGEILIRGDNVFAGYYKDEEATRAALTDDGWLRTGDVGALDEDGFLTITDRKKDIIVTAGGKNVAPQNIENELKTSKYVSQALAVGDRRPYLVALVTLDEAEARKAGVAGDLDTSAEARELIQGLVDELNANRASYEQVKRFAILPRDLSADEDELTPTLKVRRRQVETNWASTIDGLYAAPR